MSDETRIVISLDDREFKRGAQSAANASQELEKKSVKSFGAIQMAMATAAGVLIRDFVKSALSTAINSMKEFVKLSSEQQASYARLDGALASTGQYTLSASQELKNFSAQLEKNSTLTEEAVNNQMAYALSMGASTQQAKDLTLASANLAAVTGDSLEASQAKLVRTLNGEVGSLGRLIPELKNLTQEQLMAGAAADLINQKLGGKAAQEAQTFGGAIIQLGNAMEAVKKRIGELATTNPVLIKVLNLTTELFNNLADVVNRNIPTIMKLVNQAVLFMLKSISFFVINGTKMFRDIYRVFEDFSEVISSSIIGVKQSTQKLWDTIKGVFSSSIDSVKISMYSFFNEIIQQFNKTINAIRGVVGADPVSFNLFDIDGMKREAEEAKAIAEETYTNNEARRELEREGFQQAQDERMEARQLERDDTDQLMTEIEDSVKGYIKGVEEAQLLSGQKVIENKIINSGKEKEEQQGLWEAIKGIKDQEVEYDKKSGQQKLADFKSTLGQISTLQRSKSREMALVGKAAAIANATIDGYAAVVKAYNSAPPPLNFILAGAVGAAVATNIANIVSTPIGFATGGVIGGPSTSGDKLLIAANAKERVLTAEQNRNFEALTFNNNNLIPSLLSQLIDVTAQEKQRPIMLDAEPLNDRLEEVKNRSLI
jgi:hypothetical protein